jgi:hypothetical protein
MLVVVAILSVAIVTFAVGLQTSQTATTDASIRGKMHLALASYRTAISRHMVDTANWIVPTSGAGCTEAGMASFTSSLNDALENDQATTGWNAEWLEQGITFKITGLNYWVGGPSFPVGGVTIPGTFVACGGNVPDNSLQEWVIEVSQNSMNQPITGSVVLRRAYP